MNLTDSLTMKMNKHCFVEACALWHALNKTSCDSQIQVSLPQLILKLKPKDYESKFRKIPFLAVAYQKTLYCVNPSHALSHFQSSVFHVRFQKAAASTQPWRWSPQ
mmetsp:Transcript_8457/g.12250  ORF Transcript_8457/g.12250 Transcript_8457/m.12250 type:complete len:106 (+) Transcript_8457:177-494(+)